MAGIVRFNFTDVKYYAGVLLSLPFLPVLYLQGKKIKASIPVLPEAAGPKGLCTAQNPSGKTIQLITLGESTIAGVGVHTHAEGFTGTLAQELANLIQTNVAWQVYARSGYTAKRVTQELIPTIREKQVDLIVVGLGANDAFALNSPRTWRRDMHLLIECLLTKYPKSYIVFCNMPPIKEFPAFTPLIKLTIGNLVEMLGENLKTLVAEYNDVYYYGEIITVQEWVEKLEIATQKSDFFSDGVHPSKLTYQTWAKDIAARISGERAIQEELQQGN